VRFGPGSALGIADELARLPASRPGVVVDEAVADTPAVAAALARLQTEGVNPVAVLRRPGGKEPTYPELDEAVEDVRAADPDAIIGIGGGSAMDLAKGIAILLRNPGPSIQYRGMDLVPEPGVPCIVAPTTAGSGSEATATAAFIDTDSQTKLGINGRHVGAAAAILDPELLVGSPAPVTISSGLDALVHAVEAVATREPNHVSILLGAEAVRLLFDSLPRAVAEPDDVDARADTLLGAHLAGIAMQNAAGGPASGISYPLGVHWGVPHGFAGGVLLPHVVEMNVARGHVAGYALLDERLRPGAGGDAAAFSEAFWDVIDRMGAPRDFSGLGVTRANLDRLTAFTLEQRGANLAANPGAPWKEADVRELLELVLPAPAAAAGEAA
jgi:alcohol dehydrogenase